MLFCYDLKRKLCSLRHSKVCLPLEMHPFLNSVILHVVPLLLFHVFPGPLIVLSSLLSLKVSSLFSSHHLMSPFSCGLHSCTNVIVHFLHISQFCFLVLLTFFLSHLVDLSPLINKTYGELTVKWHILAKSFFSSFLEMLKII